MIPGAALGPIEILENLVAFPTVSRDSNLPLVNWIRNYLHDHHIDSTLVADRTGLKSNLFASVGPAEDGGIVLSGHSDVVPIDGQTWASDPFVLTSRGSRLHARGACDMKGFIAVALSRVPTWKASRLARPVHLMFSYDEELGCLGAPSMIAAARETLPAPAAVIVGEPTGMRVATEHKGVCALRTRISGMEAHSSLTHLGVSAIMLAGSLIARLDETARKLAAPGGRLSPRFEPPYSTISVNRIEGGNAINTLAAACEFSWDIRTLPRESATAILQAFAGWSEGMVAELLRQGKECAIETTMHADVPPLEAQGGIAEHLARYATNSTAATIAVPFATEGGHFQSVGWPTVVCGPGSIEQAHRPDEFIERSDLANCGKFLDRAVARQCQQ